MKSLFKYLSYFWEDNIKYIKAGAIILVILAAAFLFIFYGKDDQDLKIKDINNKGNHIIYGKQDESHDPPSSSHKKKSSKKSKKSQKKKSSDSENNISDGYSMYIDIEGAVVNPGVYKIREGDRIFHAIAKAGGLKDTADIKSINKAEVLSDGQKIYIFEVGEEGHSSEASPGDKSGDKININIADENKLQEIQGVGPSMANRIIEYRKSNGRFKKIDDLKNVSGIGDKRFESMKDSITI